MKKKTGKNNSANKYKKDKYKGWSKIENATEPNGSVAGIADGSTWLDEDGNTNSSSSKSRIAASKYWMFTFNNWTKEDTVILTEQIVALCSDYRVQSEIGKENSTPHLQGFIELKTKGRPIELFKNNKIHFEKCRNIDRSKLYCSKDDTSTGEFILDKTPPIALAVPLLKWQLRVIELVQKEPDNRSINWYYEYDGGVGKSVLAKWLCAKYNALCISGKSSDCKYAIASWFEEKKEYPKIIIFDVPRTSIDYLNFEAIESIKNGLFFCGKYESKQIIMNSPHIIIFANTPPDEEKLSKDRWKINFVQQEQDDDTRHSIEYVYL